MVNLQKPRGMIQITVINHIFHWDPLGTTPDAPLSLARFEICTYNVLIS